MRVKTRGWLTIGSTRVRRPKLTKKEMTLKMKHLIYSPYSLKSAWREGRIF